MCLTKLRTVISVLQFGEGEFFWSTDSKSRNRSFTVVYLPHIVIYLCEEIVDIGVKDKEILVLWMESWAVKLVRYVVTTVESK